MGTSAATAQGDLHGTEGEIVDERTHDKGASRRSGFVANTWAFLDPCVQ